MQWRDIRFQDVWAYTNGSFNSSCPLGEGIRHPIIELQNIARTGVLQYAVFMNLHSSAALWQFCYRYRRQLDSLILSLVGWYARQKLRVLFRMIGFNSTLITISLSYT
jgi:hypothetical protein